MYFIYAYIYIFFDHSTINPLATSGRNLPIMATGQMKLIDSLTRTRTIFSGQIYY